MEIALRLEAPPGTMCQRNPSPLSPNIFPASMFRENAWDAEWGSFGRCTPWLCFGIIRSWMWLKYVEDYFVNLERTQVGRRLPSWGILSSYWILIALEIVFYARSHSSVHYLIYDQQNVFHEFKIVIQDTTQAAVGLGITGVVHQCNTGASASLFHRCRIISPVY